MVVALLVGQLGPLLLLNYCAVRSRGVGPSHAHVAIR